MAGRKGGKGVPCRTDVPGGKGVPGRTDVLGKKAVPGRTDKPDKKAVPGSADKLDKKAVPGRTDESEKKAVPGRTDVPGKKAVRDRKDIPVRKHMPDRKRLALWTGCGIVLLILASWHFLDVRAGVLETGDRWLYGWYAAVCVWAGLTASGLGYVIFVWDKWKMEQIFAAASLSLGILFLFILPPLSAPDEVSHYISAYQLSSHMMGRTANAADGHVLTRVQDAFIEDLYDVMEDDGSGYRDKVGSEGGEDSGAAAHQAVVLGQELTEGTYRTIREWGLGSTGEEGTAVSYQPPVRTTPLAYVPQALGITLARVMGLGGLGLLYLGRLFNLMFFNAMGYLTIRRMPFGKEVAAGVFLLPMTLHLASSFSYDVMIISLSSYFAAVCLHLAYKAEKVHIWDVIQLALVMGVMGPCKMVYGVIAGFCLLIPVRKFGGWGKWAASAAAVLGAFGAAMVLVNRQTVAMYTEASEGYISWAEETGYTFAQLLHSPLLVLKMCYNTLMWQGEKLYSGMLGESLGNMDAVLNTPYVVILGLTAILLMLAFRKPGESIVMKMGSRIWIWFLCFLCLGALMFSMLLAWTPVTSNVINGVQGRYLLPLLPMFLLTLKNDRVVRTDCGDRPLLYLMIVMDLYVVIRIFSIVCLRVS